MNLLQRIFHRERPSVADAQAQRAYQTEQRLLAEQMKHAPAEASANRWDGATFRRQNRMSGTAPGEVIQRPFSRLDEIERRICDEATSQEATVR